MGDTKLLMIISKTVISPRCEKCGYDGSLTGVVTSCLDCFVKGGTLRRFEYGVGIFRRILAVRGVCSRAVSDAPEIVLERARYFEKRKTFGTYDLLENNCKHFAYYCKTGKIKDGAHKYAAVSEVEALITKMVRERSLILFLQSGCYCLACETDQRLCWEGSKDCWSMHFLLRFAHIGRPLLANGHS